jgi:hypothetical protein
VTISNLKVAITISYNDTEYSNNGRLEYWNVGILGGPQRKNLF